jgi:SAM-dependent methyltransferase
MDHKEPWDKDYKSRGRLWGGSARRLPDLPEGSLVLELGCGNGKTLASMISKPWKIMAVDISFQALRLCGPSKAERLAADVRYLPFKDGVFGALFAFHVTGHLFQEGRRMAASEACRVLEAGGKIFFAEFGLDDFRYGQGEEVEPGTFKRGSGILTHYFSTDEVKDLFSSLRVQSLEVHSWRMRVQGQDLPRSEVEAAFQKS